MRRTAWLAAALILTGHAGAAARGPIEIGAADAYAHAPAGVSVPASLDGIARVAAMELGETAQVDVGLDYRNADRSEVTTVYVFRLALGSPEVWFDRARISLIANRQLGKLQPAQAEMFAPPGAPVPSGMRAIHALEGGPLRSTAVALVPAGGWMVKLRLSSATLDREGMRARLDRTIAAIRWPSFAQARPAHATERCAQPLATGGPARPLGGDGLAAGLIGAVLAGAEPKADGAGADGAPARPVRWCRDAVVNGGAVVYRPDEAADAYMLALSDGGVGLWVHHLPLDLPEGRGWSASLVQLDRQLFFPLHDAMLQPQQAIDLLQNGKPISATKTWPRGGGISLAVPAR